MINREKILATEQSDSRFSLENPSEGRPHAWLFFAALFGTTIVLLQGFWQSSTPFISNVYVPDSYILFRGALSNFSIDWTNLLDSSSIGLQLFYGPFEIIDSRLLFIPNLAIWLACIWAAYQIFYPVHHRAAQFATIAIVFNPYLLISLSGPTKELPLLFLVLFFLLVEPTWKRLPYFALIILVTYYIRDGYALIMLGWLAIHLILPKRFWLIGRLTLCLIPLLLLLGQKTYASPFTFSKEFEGEARGITKKASTSEIGRNNIDRALESLGDPWLTAREYGYRILADGFSDLIRPTLLTVSNRISLIGVGYFVHAFLLAAGLVAVVGACLSSHEVERVHYLSWFVVLVWAVVGIVLFIQPRYLMPITPVAMGILGTRATATRILIIFVLVAASIMGYLFLTYILNIDPNYSIDNPVRPPFFFGTD